MTVRPPQPGAVKVYKLAPVDVEGGPFDWLRAWYEMRGWELLEIGHDVTSWGSRYAMVSAWAIRPRADDGEVA
jgi:hypothetical protein